MKKKPIKPIRIFNKPIGSIRFYKLETKKTKLSQTGKKSSQTRKKPSQIEKNRAKPKKRAKLETTESK